ncbi:MAG: pyruvate dehydrogenase (acetyl-transferring) E1 component subunit alpha [Alphaproteobacteria bacterium CG_4_10_14_0_8_um_filter_53_9]|nr:MAG: pyruvate dehydrogenase (acetyl-transferring) E1 component subunit alpha [Alphaproteobacteria bacterium CG_4_10_14_0_8_um_filter_53_9]
MGSALSKEVLVKAWGDMCLARRFEEKAALLYQQGEIAGFCHLYIGQEAVAVGCKLACPTDDFITSYRCHVHALLCGISPEAIMAELCGRETGISGGKGGSMHMFEPSLGFYGGHGIVAAQVPLGAGLGFASKYLKDGKVSLTFIGDGAMNAGQVFESFNMAALWKLPVIFIIENNQYGMGTSVPRAAAGELWKRAEPFGIPAEKVDGMDVMAVHEAVSRAAEYARSGKGPYVLEMDTYRYRGHSMSDPAKYRTREDVDLVRDTRDPLSKLQKVLMETHGMSLDDFEAVDAEVLARVDAVAAEALAAPRPGAGELWNHVTR